jgi:hypothetical protein
MCLIPAALLLLLLFLLLLLLLLLFTGVAKSVQCAQPGCADAR